MIKGPVGATVLALMLIGGGTVRADILYFNDTTASTDSMAIALSQYTASHPGVSVYTTNSDSTFATQLATGKYNLAIFFDQNFFPSSLSNGVSALQAWVAGGGKAIVDDFATTQGNGFVSPFGANFSGPVNKNQFTVTNPNLSTGLYTISNTGGWLTYTTDLTATTGVAAGYFTPNDPTTGAIIVGNGGKTILNGFLNDSFTDPNQGAALFTAELNAVQLGFNALCARHGPRTWQSHPARHGRGRPRGIRLATAEER